MVWKEGGAFLAQRWRGGGWGGGVGGGEKRFEPVALIMLCKVRVLL